MGEQIPRENEPWWSREHGWCVAALPVDWWQSAYDERRIPERWLTPPYGGGDVDPSDYELECYVHLILHEQARLAGTELGMLYDCIGIVTPMPAQAVTAAANGQTLVPWCPGVSWNWREENRSEPIASKFNA